MNEKHKNERKTRNEDNDADGGCIDMCFLWEDPHESSTLPEHADESTKVRAPIAHTMPLDVRDDGVVQFIAQSTMYEFQA